MRSVLLSLIAGAAVCISWAPQAEAQSSLLASYEVQVKYWFWDYEGVYMWDTVLETQDHSQATFVYNLLLFAKENNQLNDVVPYDYWRWIAVDVRLVTKYRFRWRSSWWASAYD